MDLEKIRAEYVTGDMSYTQLAAKHGLNASSLRREGAKGKWADQRKAFHKTLADKAIEAKKNQGLREIERQMKLAVRFNDMLERLMDDPEQFYKVVTPKGEELITTKADTRAMKHAADMFSEVIKATRNLYGIPDRMEDRKDRREERRVKLAENQAGNVSESQAGIVLMPQILPEEPEDAPEVNG